MTSGIDADLLADLKANPNNALILFELDLAGTTQKYAETWAASSTGLYEGYVVDGGSITRGVSDSNFQLPRDSARITVMDPDRALEQIIMGTAVGNVSGIEARIKLASSSLAQSKWFPLFTGVIEDFSRTKNFEWDFSLRRDDLALTGLLFIPDIQVYDWPNAPTESLGLPTQIIYGKHSSTGTSVNGMVPTTYVDNSGFRYLISYGRISSLDAVYVDGSLDTTGDYSLTYVETNGRSWSLVDFTGDKGDVTVTVDCEGIETDGDGSSGTVIVNPATQLEHLLTNFVFGSWTNGSWLTTANYPINETFFAEAETFLSDKGIAKGSRVITGERKGIDILNEITKQLQIPSFWTYDGKIAIRPNDHTLTNTYITAPYFRQDFSPEPEELSVDYLAKNLLDTIKVDFLYSESDGAFQKSLTIKNPTKSYNKTESLQLHWRESVN